MPKYKTIEDLKRFSVLDFEDFLKHYWKTEEFTFVATFVSEKKRRTKGLGVLKTLEKKEKTFT